MYPLKGVNVLSFEQAVAAPFATRQLADLGARVIKIERPGVGDFARHYDKTVKGLSSHFVWLNRSKESLTLDLKNPKSNNIIQKLIKKSDIFIQNLAPGAVDRLGYTNKMLTKLNPKLIVCNISGYGPGGSYSLKKAYDLLIQCESGFLSLTGTEDTPSKAGISIADIAAGMYSYTGILTALFQREKTGKGVSFDISMLEALGEWMSFPAYFTNYGKKKILRTGSSHATIYPYGSFESSDKKSIFFGIQNEREWKSFCKNVLRDSNIFSNNKFNSNSKRNKNRTALGKIISGVLSTVTSNEITKRLDDSKIANANLNNMKQFWNHKQFKDRKRWRSVNSPFGKIDALIPPVVLKGQKLKMNKIPKIGEHSKKILLEIGFTKREIEDLKKNNII